MTDVLRDVGLNGPEIRSAIYARASRLRDGTREGMGVERQVKACREAIGTDPKAKLVLECVDDGVSGEETASLNQLQVLLKAVNARQIDSICVERFDRIGRNAGQVIAHLKLLAEKKVRLYSLNEGLIDPLLGGLLASFAQEELEKTRVRIRDSRHARFKKKRALGLRKFGYDIGENDEYIVDPFEAEAVRIAFRIYGSGRGGATIVGQVLEALGFPSPEGGPWARALLGKRKIVDGDVFRIGGLFNNHCYMGRRPLGMSSWKTEGGRKVLTYSHPSKWEWADHPPIVTQAEWDAVQSRIAKLEDQFHPDGGLRQPADYLLNNKLVCHDCGSKMLVTNGATVSNRPWGRTARVVCSGALRGTCKETHGYDMAALQTSVLWALLHMADALTEPMKSPDQLASINRADVQREVGRLSLAIRNAKDPAEVTALDKKRASALRVLKEVDAARRPGPPARTMRQKVDAVLRALPRHLRDANESTQSDAEDVRDLIAACRVAPRGHKNGAYLIIETRIGTWEGWSHVIFKSKVNAGFNVLFPHLRRGNHLSVRAAMELVVNRAMDHKHGLRGLQFLERVGLAAKNGNEWKWSGTEPLVVKGCAIWVAHEASRIDPPSETTDGPA